MSAHTIAESAIVRIAQDDIVSWPISLAQMEKYLRGSGLAGELNFRGIC